MTHAPDTADLIATARATLKAEILPHLPPRRLYQGRMVLNALAIALRQLEAGAARRQAARDALAPFASGGDLEAITAALARALREGPPADPAPLHGALMQVARSAIEESNPGARILADLDASEAAGRPGRPAPPTTLQASRS